MVIENNIGKKIRLVREKKKITQEELAKRLGVSRQAICMWETNKREINLTTLARLAEVLEVSLSYIIGGVKMKKGERKVVFQLKAPAATRVSLSGDFNAWDGEGIPLKRGRGGLWSTTLGLKPGRYEYRFIVDGQWITDPENSLSAPNPFGSQNSVKEVI